MNNDSIGFLEFGLYTLFVVCFIIVLKFFGSHFDNNHKTTINNSPKTTSSQTFLSPGLLIEAGHLSIHRH